MGLPVEYACRARDLWLVIWSCKGNVIRKKSLLLVTDLSWRMLFLKHPAPANILPLVVSLV